MTLPATRLIRQYDTHRLIAAKYSEGGDSVLRQIAEDDAHLADLRELETATDSVRLAEHDLLPGIGIHELVFAVPYDHIVNAAFCHAHPLGSRFNGPDRGAWYAACELETGQAEVAFHKWMELAEVGWLQEEVIYDDYLADFSAEFHDVRRDERFADCLAPDSYVASQGLTRRLMEAGSLGIVYPSVRRPRGTRIACFRPALVMNVRRCAAYVFRWDGEPDPTIVTA